MDRDLARALCKERKRLLPIHTNDTARICEGVLLWQREHLGEDQNYRMLENIKYGGTPKSTYSDFVKATREGGDNSPYIQAAYNAGFYLRAPPVIFIDVRPMFSARAWENHNNEEFQRRHAVLKLEEE